MTVVERGCASSPVLGVPTPRSREGTGEGGDDFTLPEVAVVPIYLRWGWRTCWYAGIICAHQRKGEET